MINHDDFITYIGNRRVWGGEKTFGIQNVDARRHVYILGKTGSGKTSLLHNLILQHIVAGDGVGVLDPHGDLVEGLLEHIPRNRINDVLYFNPRDMDFPMSFNVLGRIPPDERPVVVSAIVGACKSIWRDSWGPRMEYVMYNAIAALMESEHTSLLGLSRMLSNDTYRHWVVEQIRDPFLRAFWEDEYERYDARFRQEMVSPVLNKVGQLFSHPAVRHILGQVRKSLDPRTIMDEGGVFLANLSKGTLGEDKANLLGSFLVSLFQSAAMGRATMAERRDFFLFIDEFPNFTTDSFTSILSEARKYGLCLTLSHQYIDQMAEEVRKAVFGNCGTILAFRVGYGDAEILEKEFGGDFTAGELAELGRYEMAAKLLEDGTTYSTFRGMTIPPLSLSYSQHKPKIIRQSRLRFCRPRREVESNLYRWLKRFQNE